MTSGAQKRELKRVELGIIKRLLMVLYCNKGIKKTSIAMKSGLSYDRCVLYLDWMKTIDLIKKEVDNDGFELISLTDRGQDLYEMKFNQEKTYFAR